MLKVKITQCAGHNSTNTTHYPYILYIVYNVQVCTWTPTISMIGIIIISQQDAIHSTGVPQPEYIVADGGKRVCGINSKLG